MKPIAKQYYVLAGLLVSQLSAQTPIFNEVASQFGANLGRDGTGCVWADFDRDQHLDLLVVNSAGAYPPQLYMNPGDGTPFVEIGELIGLSIGRSAQGLACADYDNDGYLDIFIAGAGNDPTILFKNNGDGTFHNATIEAGVSVTGSQGMATWVDYDQDGYVDLYLPYANHSQNNRSRLFHNDGNESFSEEDPIQVGFDDSEIVGGVAWGDYDDDGDADLFVSFDNPGNPAKLYRNNGDRSFTNVANDANVANTAGSRGVMWGDYDNDLDLDLFLNNVGEGGTGGRNALYQNRGDGTFENVTDCVGVPAETYNGLGSTWGDFDNDGDLDLYVANYGQSNHFYLNEWGTCDDTPQHIFRNIANLNGTDDGGFAIGVTAGDFDADGDLDIYSANSLANANRLFQNVGNNHHWLQVELEGVLSNRSAIGATVIVSQQGLTQRRDVSGGSGYYSQPSLPVEFGFGSESSSVAVTILWPSGIQQNIAGLVVDQLIQIQEPASFDSDGDGVVDAEDPCPETNTNPTIILAEVDTGVANLFLNPGCKMSDTLSEVLQISENRRDLITTIASLTNEWKTTGLITGREKGQIMQAAVKIAF